MPSTPSVKLLDPLKDVCHFVHADVEDAASASAAFQRLLQAASDPRQLLALLALLQGPWRRCFERSVPQPLHANDAAGSQQTAALAEAIPGQSGSQEEAQAGAAVGTAEAEHAAGEGDGWEHAQDLDLTGALSAHAETGEEPAPSSGAAAAAGLSIGTGAATEAIGWQNGDAEEPASAETGGVGEQSGDAHEHDSLEHSEPGAKQHMPDEAGEAEAVCTVSEEGPEIAALHSCWAALLPRMLAHPPGADAGGPIAGEALRVVEATASLPQLLLTSAEALSIVGACRSAGGLICLPVLSQTSPPVASCLHAAAALWMDDRTAMLQFGRANDLTDH